MFNRGGVSAYGRGIASNLVTEEQRQRFNYGGRVGFAQKSYVRPEFAIAAEREMKGPLYTEPWLTEQFKKKYYLDTEEADTGVPIIGMQGMIETEGDFGIDGRPVLSPVESRTRKLLKENPEAFKDYYQDYETTYKDKIAKQKDILTAGGKDTSMFDEIVQEDKNPDQTGIDEILTGQNIIENPSTVKEDTTVLDVLDEQESKARKGKAIMSLGKMAHDWFTAPTATKKAAATSKGLENIQKSLDPSDALKTKRTYHEWEKARSSTEEKKLKTALNLSSSEAGQEVAANRAGKTDLEKLTSIYGVTISKAPTKKEKGKTVGIDLIAMGADPEKYKDTVVKDPTRANLYWVIDTNNKPRSINYKQVIELQKGGFFNIGANK